MCLILSITLSPITLLYHHLPPKLYIRRLQHFPTAPPLLNPILSSFSKCNCLHFVISLLLSKINLSLSFPS